MVRNCDLYFTALLVATDGDRVLRVEMKSTKAIVRYVSKVAESGQAGLLNPV